MNVLVALTDGPDQLRDIEYLIGNARGLRSRRSRHYPRPGRVHPLGRRWLLANGVDEALKHAGSMASGLATEIEREGGSIRAARLHGALSVSLRMAHDALALTRVEHQGPSARPETREALQAVSLMSTVMRWAAYIDEIADALWSEDRRFPRV